MPAYQVRTGQLGLVGGIRQQSSDRILAVDPANLFSPEARKGQLYVLVEPEGDPGAGRDACQIVSRTLKKTFYADHSYSLTSALREALRVANRALYQHNFGAPQHRRVAVGASCAALRGADLYLAQVAPSQAYVLSEGKLRALPTPQGWNSAHSSAAPFLKRAALGASLSVEAELYRCTLRPGDALLICSSNLSRLLPREQVEQLLRFHDPAAAVEQLQSLCQQHGLADAHALALELMPPLSAGARARPLSPGGLGERVALMGRLAGDWLGGLSGEAARLVRRPKPPRVEARGAAVSPDGLLVDPAPLPRPINMGAPLPETAAPQIEPPLIGEVELPPSAFLGERLDHEPGGKRRIDLSDAPALDAAASPFRPQFERRPFVDMGWGERLLWPVQRAVNSVARARREPLFLGRQRYKPRQQPPFQPVARGKGLSYRRQSPPFPWLWLVLLVSLVSVFILYGMTLSRDRADDDAKRYIMQAEERMAAVRAAPDDNAALDRLDSARAALEELRASPLITVTNADAWLRYQELSREYDRALASLQRLSYVDSVEVLATHPLPTGRFDSVVVPPSRNITDTSALGYIYLLDANPDSGMLYRIATAECNLNPNAPCGPPEPFLKPNDTIANTVVGPVRAHAWREDNVIAVDQGEGGSSYYFRNGGQWSFTRLAGSELWSPKKPIDIELYDGNLYVWGAEEGQILKFTTGRYGDLPVPWIDQTKLSGRDVTSAVDMAIDGNIYLLHLDGKVDVMIANGFERQIVPETISPPITKVTRFFVTGPPDSGFIFLVEPLNERIIQIDKLSGKVIQQIRTRPEAAVRFSELRYVYVDDSGRSVLYIVNGPQVLRMALPAPPRPFRGSGTPVPATPSPSSASP
jgi:hypothetical protein